MKKTYKQNPIHRSVMKSVKRTEGMTMEMMVGRFLNNQIDVEQTQPIVYTERKDGVMAGYDIRTDRFDIAIDAMDKSAKSMTAKRETKLNVVKEEDGKPDSIEGTESK